MEGGSKFNSLAIQFYRFVYPQISKGWKGSIKEDRKEIAACISVYYSATIIVFAIEYTRVSFCTSLSSVLYPMTLGPLVAQDVIKHETAASSYPISTMRPI
mmetsp:Transcript_21086/g.33102  ORF Transcript_21086/g.33102 Transcript_21086/m.33102 type:complete len:101 (+) Transcript_21086:119-421(+)